jgi:GTP pyrophosphokinase
MTSSETDFETWLASLPVDWRANDVDVVRHAYALTTPQGMAVADLLADLHMDYEVVTAALLYDGVETGALSLATVKERFGAAIAQLVDDVAVLNVIAHLHQQGSHAHQQLESLRKMLLAMAKDVRVVLIKLAVQLNKLRHISRFPAAEQQSIARETLDIFAPLANRLGIAQFKWELEDLSLRCLQPATYKQLAKALEERRSEREYSIANVVQQLQEELQKAGIRADVSGRAKHIYSIWRKMQRKQLPFEEIFDVRAVRIMVHSVADCYAALGIVHALWSHIRREFDDYIANPKNNGYQSLHTAVRGPQGKTLEVQIRSWEMHHNAELGVAAHWRYKEGGQSSGSAFDRQIAWLRQILEWKEEETADASDFLDRFKAEAFQDRVYVVTPQGAIMEMAQGATPLDFAYHIHTDVGHRCRGAKVNGRIVPLSYELKNGEQVEVLTAKNAAPSRDWLSPHLGYLKTSRARSKVRQWFRLQDQEKNMAAGRVVLERELQRLGVDIKQVDLQKIAEKANFNKPEELFAAVGYGDITTASVASKAQELILPPPPETLPLARKSHVGEGKGEIKIRGVGNLLTHIAQCCKPVPLEPIMGYITQGRGIAIHRQDCPNRMDLSSRHQERVIEVDWGEETHAAYAVDVLIKAYDRSGLLRDITLVLLQDQINVLASNTRTDPKTLIAHMVLTLEISDIGQLSRILDKIAQIPNVMKARRKSK